MAERYPIGITGEPERKLGHVEVAVHYPELTENRRTALAQDLLNQVGIEPVVARRDGCMGCKNTLLAHRFYLCFRHTLLEMRALGYTNVHVFHMNEGHSAFMWKTCTFV